MEILFENSHVRNKELAKEMYRYLYFQRTVSVVCCAVMFICFIINIVVAAVTEVYIWIAIVITPIFFLYRFYCYVYQVNIMVRRDNEMYGKEITVETIVTDDFIQNTTCTGEAAKLEWSKIKSVDQTKNLILLHSEANLIYIIRKDTFTKGTKEEFIDFLRGKGVKIK